VGSSANPPATPAGSSAAAAASKAERDPSDRRDPSAAPATTGDADASTAASESEPKFDFEAMLKRERQALPLGPLMDPKGRWRGSMEARRPPVLVDRDDHISIRTNIGTKNEIRCEVHEGQLNPGVTVATLLGVTTNTVELESATVYRVGSAAAAPVLFVDARYVTREQPRLGGELKLAISPGAMFSFICLHDEPGYRESFARIVEGMIRSIETREPNRLPHYSAIWQLQVGEAKTGYGWERIFIEPDGSISSFAFDVVLAPLASGKLRIRDFMAAEVHDQSGIVRGNFLSYHGTSQAYELELLRTEGGAYTSKGNVEGKPMDARFTPRGPLGSSYELLMQLERARLAGGPAAFRRDEYRPRLDTARVQSAEYAFDASSGMLTRREGSSTDTWSIANGLPSGSRETSGPNTFIGTVVAQQSALGSEPGTARGSLPAPDAQAPLPLAERRRALTTRVFAETDHTPAKSPPAGVLTKVTYPAPLGANVAYVTPPRSGSKRPAVVWIGGGLDWNIGDVAWRPAPREDDRSARAFREAGLVLMLPALRGSNENPGRNECFLGEVDDVIAAADHLASRADVDAERVYLAGHGTGATLALLAAASSDRFRAVFAFGPVGDARQYGTPTGGGCLPADAAPEELALRAPIEFVASIRTPTFVFEGGADGGAEAFDALRAAASNSVFFSVVPGVDSKSILAPGTEAIARAILAGQVDESHLVIRSKPSTRAAKPSVATPPAQPPAPKPAPAQPDAAKPETTKPRAGD
jgi:acetyl esterase/lipase